MAFETILLDIDGTLVESNGAHASAWHDAFAQAGYSIDAAAIRPLIGMGGDKIIPLLAPGLDAHTGKGKEIGERREAIFAERYLPALRPTRGARDLVLALRDRDLTIALATSAKPDEIDPLLRAAHLEDLIDYRADSGSATPSKPDPDIVQSALERSKTPSARALLVGDSRFDIEGASKAGVATIALRCGGSDDADLRGAIAIYDDPADLLAHLDRSALAYYPSIR